MSDFSIDTRPLAIAAFGGTAMAAMGVMSEIVSIGAAARSARNVSEWHAVYQRQSATINHLIDVARAKNSALEETEAELAQSRAELAQARAQVSKLARALA